MDTIDKIKLKKQDAKNQSIVLLIGIGFCIIWFQFIEWYGESDSEYLNVILFTPFIITTLYFLRVLFVLYDTLKLSFLGESRVKIDELSEVDSIVKYKGKVFTGEAYEKSKNGHLIKEEFYNKGKKNSRVEYYETGQLEVEETFDEKGKSLEYKTYHKNGQLAQSVKLGKPVIKGNKRVKEYESECYDEIGNKIDCN